MPKIKLHSTLFIHSLELSVNLGWRKQERKNEQAVLLNMDITFPRPPGACATDDLEDTVCYAALIEDIRAKIAKKNYRLIEHLSAEIYQIAKAFLPNKTRLNVRITKRPKIDGLRDGVSFNYGDN
jgi:7,8-dihydroneopterin aldolase/epimerase/oxygenase